MKKQCQDYATALLDHTRSSYELEVLLNYDANGPVYNVSKLPKVYREKMNFTTSMLNGGKSKDIYNKQLETSCELILILYFKLKIPLIRFNLA